ncbi:MAG TPA: hypothetical protein VGP82_17975 [Ktedonobacterales bacterium]|nr:hypothetical protein [Ktedonobacterales bacterium]
MLDAFDVLMPAFRDRVRGKLRPVLGSRCGALLLDGTAGRSGSAALYDELELYLQAAGITCLRVSGLPYEGVARRARELLASVTQLRSLGVERIILIVSSDNTLPDRVHASSDTLADFLSFIVEQSQTMTALLRAVRSLVSGVRVVADSVVGVATLVPAYSTSAPGHAGRKRSSLQLMRPQAQLDATSEVLDAAPSPPAQNRPVLLLDLPDVKDARQSRRRVDVLSRLYGWSISVSGIEAEPAAFLPDDSLGVEPGVEANGWHDIMAWLEEQWNKILDTKINRKPDVDADFQVFLHRSSHVSVLSQARETWRYLDNETRLQWLAVCAQAFTASYDKSDAPLGATASTRRPNEEPA